MERQVIGSAEYWHPTPGTQGLRERLGAPRVDRHVEISVITDLRTEQGVDTAPTNPPAQWSTETARNLVLHALRDFKQFHNGHRPRQAIANLRPPCSARPAHDLHSSRSSSLNLPAATRGRSSCSTLSIHSLAGGTSASDSKRRCIRARLHKGVELAAVVNRISRSPSELARGRFRSRPSASRCRTRRSAAYR
jgi:hypothetical protein